MTEIQQLLAAAIAAIVISLLVCRVFVRLGGAGLMLDEPNARSLHVRPVPRSGGLAIAAGLLPALLLVFPSADIQLRAIIAGWLLVFCVSLLDDFRDLPAVSRLLVHVVAAWIVLYVREGDIASLEMLLGVFCIVWGTNLFNFMDGMDGLAGSMALIGGSILAIALLLAGVQLPAILVGAAAAAAAGFLFYNLPPAQIFMGDSGSAPLGFLFSAVAVSSVQQGAVPAWLPLLVFLPFVADATFTLVRRAWQRKRIWQAHREHAYQALVIGGRSVGRVLLLEVMAMLLCGLAALVAALFGGGHLLLSAALLLSAVLYWVIMRESIRGA